MLGEREMKIHCNCPKYGHSGLVGSFNAFGYKDANANNKKDFYSYTEKEVKESVFPHKKKDMVENW